MTIVLLVLLGQGCSWVFMQKPESHYSRNTQPQCSDGKGWPLVDGIFAALNIIGAGTIASDDRYTQDQKTGYLLGGIGWGVIHVASAISGIGYADTCREAKERYNEAPEEITPTEERRRRALESRLAREEARRYDRERRRDKAREAAQGEEDAEAQPRGFFCSGSPGDVAVGFCMRQKPECEAARDAAIVGVADLTECVLTERAFCFGDRCAPNAEACDATRQRALGPDGSGDPCEDSE